jgi:HAD superfamily hydrolase (TIGR01548 family)
MAGLRVGYAIGPESLVRAMRSAGSPYPVSGLSLAVAERASAAAGTTQAAAIAEVRSERERLSTLLTELAARPRPTQGNFVFATFDDADWVWRALAGLGIGVRRFPGGAGLERSLRITCPGDEQDFNRLCQGVRAAMRPLALLLDMDGVIADVSRSYRAAILSTARTFGVELSAQDVAAAKALPGSNNDWHVTRRMLAERGVEASIEEVTARFEAIYQGTGAVPGLRETETLLTPRALLESLRRRTRLAIVTGRPRADARAFLERFAIADLFEHVVCMEDAPTKPDPAPVQLAMKRLGVRAAWMVGDTPDDVIAARRAGVVPIGIPPPGHSPDDAARVRGVLASCGAARVIEHMTELETLLP